MELSVLDWRRMFLHAARVLKRNGPALSRLDSEFGDGDHGIVIGMIACRFEEVCEKWDCHRSLRDFMFCLARHVNGVGRGATGTLWGALFGGMAEAIDEQQDMDCLMLRKAFRNGVRQVSLISTAVAGDKTMMDALIPAEIAIQSCASGSPVVLLRSAADAALIGADKTMVYAAKFSHAKNFGTLMGVGHKDPGAVSLALLLEAWADAVELQK